MNEYRGIALVGPMAAGKTTVADAMIDLYGFRKISMIGAFRELFARAYPGIGKGDSLTVEREKRCQWIDCPAGDPSDNPHVHANTVTVSGREQMQDFAPATRAIDNMFWTRVAFNDAERLMAEGIPLVSDDVRFPTEAEMARERGFLVVRIETPRDVRLERYERAYGRLPTEAEESAPTERSIDLIEADMTIDGRDNPLTNAYNLAGLVVRPDRVRITKEDTTTE